MTNDQRSISEYVRAYWPQIDAARKTTDLAVTTIAKALIMKAPDSEGWTVDSVTRIIRRVAKRGDDRSISERDAATLAAVGLDVKVPATLPARGNAQLALGGDELTNPADPLKPTPSPDTGNGRAVDTHPGPVLPLQQAPAFAAPVPENARTGPTGNALGEPDLGRDPVAPEPPAVTQAPSPQAAPRTGSSSLRARESLLD
jgi:hypothetical protein